MDAINIKSALWAVHETPDGLHLGVTARTQRNSHNGSLTQNMEAKICNELHIQRLLTPDLCVVAIGRTGVYQPCLHTDVGSVLT